MDPNSDGLLTDYYCQSSYESRNNTVEVAFVVGDLHRACVVYQQPQPHFITMTERKSSPYDPQMELLHKVLDE